MWHPTNTCNIFPCFHTTRLTINFKQNLERPESWSWAKSLEILSERKKKLYKSKKSYFDPSNLLPESGPSTLGYPEDTFNISPCIYTARMTCNLKRYETRIRGRVNYVDHKNGRPGSGSGKWSRDWRRRRLVKGMLGCLDAGQVCARHLGARWRTFRSVQGSASSALGVSGPGSMHVYDFDNPISFPPPAPRRRRRDVPSSPPTGVTSPSGVFTVRTLSRRRTAATTTHLVFVVVKFLRSTEKKSKGFLLWNNGPGKLLIRRHTYRVWSDHTVWNGRFSWPSSLSSSYVPGRKIQRVFASERRTRDIVEIDRQSERRRKEMEYGRSYCLKWLVPMD